MVMLFGYEGVWLTGTGLTKKHAARAGRQGVLYDETLIRGRFVIRWNLARLDCSDSSTRSGAQPNVGKRRAT